MKKAVKLIIAGTAFLAAGLAIGFGGTLVAMVRSFNQVAQSAKPRPESLADGVSMALVTTAIGIPLALIGLSLIVGGLVVYFREPE